MPVRQKERSVWASVLYRTSWSCLSPGLWAFTRTYSRRTAPNDFCACSLRQTETRFTSRTVISFSFSFPALFFTCVFLVSTHTTLSFTSDLSTQTVVFSPVYLLSLHMLRADSLLDAQVGKRCVQEGEGLVCGVGLQLDGQRHRLGDLPL